MSNVTQMKLPVDTRKKISDDGIQEWVNQLTGEVRYVQEIDVKCTDKGFEKVWLGALLSTLDILGNKKLKVVKALLEKKSRSDNTVTIKRQADLAKELGVSKQTVTDTFKALRDVNFIRQVVPGHYILNPSVIWRGSAGGRHAVMMKFNTSQQQAELFDFDTGSKVNEG